ncbi:MAG: STAS domain-containing protein [Ignavibacteria bacterium]
MEEFSINKKQQDNITILSLNGFLDAHTSVELEKSFEEVLSEKNYKIVVNFEKLTYISSAGLGVFMAFIENARENSGDIKLCGMSEKFITYSICWVSPYYSKFIKKKISY